jgi:hypothetical protein
VSFEDADDGAIQRLPIRDAGFVVEIHPDFNLHPFGSMLLPDAAVAGFLADNLAQPVINLGPNPNSSAKAARTRVRPRSPKFFTLPRRGKFVQSVPSCVLSFEAIIVTRFSSLRTF